MSDGLSDARRAAQEYADATTKRAIEELRSEGCTDEQIAALPSNMVEWLGDTLYELERAIEDEATAIGRRRAYERSRQREMARIKHALSSPRSSAD